MPLNWASTPTLDELAGTAPPSPPAAPPLSFLDKLKLSWKQAGAQPDWGFNQTNWQGSALSEVNDALRKKGIQPAVDLSDYGAIERTMPQQRGEPYDQYLNRAYQTLFGQIAQVRQSDPNFLPDYAPVVDKGTFDQLIADRRNKALGNVAQQAPDGLGLVGFGGQVAHGAIDPISWIPLGGPAADATSIGGRILTQALHGAAANAAITTVTEPLVREDAARLGQQRTTGDFFRDLFTSSTLGAGFGGAVEGLRVGADHVASVFQRKAPEPAPTGAPMDSQATRIAETFAEIVPEDQRTPDEKAALAAIQRDAEVKATSPFVPGPAGDDAHAAALDRGLQTVNGGDLPQRGPVKPIARESIAGPDEVDGTRFPARELLKANIHAAEGDGPNRAGGAAFGPYQFEPRTWVNLFKRRYPDDPRSFDEIAALRGDPHLNDVLINDLISENAKALRHAGFEENAGNLYLAHVLGHDRAVRVLSADPTARLRDLLPDGYFKGNPFKPGDTAASLVHWAYGKMGDPAGLPVHIADAEGTEAGSQAISEAETAPEVQPPPTGKFDVEALYGDVGMADRPVLNPELFQSPEEHAAAQLRFERASDAADGFAPVMSRAEAFAPAEHFDALRAYANGRGTVTAQTIGEALGLDPDEVVRAVRTMMQSDSNSPFVLARERGAPKDAEQTRVIRRPTPPRSPDSLIPFLRRRGGLNADAAGEIVHMAGGVEQAGRLADTRLQAAREEFRNAKFSKAPRGLREHRIDMAQRRLDEAQQAVKINPRGIGADEALQAAIEAGYFPELPSYAKTYEGLPDVQHLYDAIDAELRGTPRYALHDEAAIAEARHQAMIERYGTEEEKAAIMAEAMPRRMTPEEISTYVDYGDYEHMLFVAHDEGLTPIGDDVLVEAAQRWNDDQDVHEALHDAVMAAADRELHEYAAWAGEMGYEPSHDVAAYIGDRAEARGAGGAGGEDEPGSGRSAAVASAEDQSRAALEAAAHDPARGEFSDPVGSAAEAQADSIIHDAEMAEAGGGTAYRLDEEGGESDLQSILAEIEDAQKAVDEMRGCLKPKGGEE